MADSSNTQQHIFSLWKYVIDIIQRKNDIPIFIRKKHSIKISTHCMTLFYIQYNMQIALCLRCWSHHKRRITSSISLGELLRNSPYRTNALIQKGFSAKRTKREVTAIVFFYNEKWCCLFAISHSYTNTYIFLRWVATQQFASGEHVTIFPPWSFPTGTTM